MLHYACEESTNVASFCAVIYIHASDRCETRCPVLSTGFDIISSNVVARERGRERERERDKDRDRDRGWTLVAFTVCCSRLVPLRWLTVIQHPLYHNALPLESQVPLFIVIQSFPASSIRNSMRRLRVLRGGYDIIQTQTTRTDRSTKQKGFLSLSIPRDNSIYRYHAEKLHGRILSLINVARGRSCCRQQWCSLLCAHDQLWHTYNSDTYIREIELSRDIIYIKNH